MEENRECKHFIKSNRKCSIDLSFCSKKRKLCEVRKLGIIYEICLQCLDDDFIRPIMERIIDIIEE